MVREFARGVGLCQVCEQQVRVVSGHGWRAVAAEHTVDAQVCRGVGLAEVGWAQARGVAQWEQMSEEDRGVALAHVLECTVPRSLMRAQHPEHVYRGAGLRGLSPEQVCAHAWDQTDGWHAAVERWGQEAVGAWLGTQRLSPRGLLRRYGFPAQASLYVVEGRALGVVVPRGVERPGGWRWGQQAGPGGRCVLLPDARSRTGRVVQRELSVVKVPEPRRVGSGSGAEVVQRQLLEAAARGEPLSVELADGRRVVYHPVTA